MHVRRNNSKKLMDFKIKNPSKIVTPKQYYNNKSIILESKHLFE